MPTFTLRTAMPVSAKTLSDWHANAGAFERLNPVFDPVTLVSREGGLEVGARTVVELKTGPVTQRWVAVHTAYEPGRMFRDEQQGGPFRKWVHTHRFQEGPDGTSTLEDSIEYELPLGGLGRFVAGSYARHKLEAAFAYRHALTRADLLRHARFAERPRLVVALTGASGLLGTTLRTFLSSGGHEVRVIGRAGGRLDPRGLEGADAVVHLAGAGVADERWTPERKQLLVDSRVDYTRQLVAALAGLTRRPKVLLAGSAVGLYGDRGDEWLTEASAPGPRAEGGAGFLSGLCVDWEAQALEARQLGLRVVCLRTGVVLTPAGGALAKLLPPFNAGVGGPTGSGSQYLSWISAEDAVGAMHHALFTEALQGPVNLVAPNPETSRDFAHTLGHVLGRPSFTPTPDFALLGLFGDLARATILSGQRVRPSALEHAGFEFMHPTLESALRFELGRP
jgi:hypothetical protein